MRYCVVFAPASTRFPLFPFTPSHCFRSPSRVGASGRVWAGVGGSGREWESVGGMSAALSRRPASCVGELIVMLIAPRPKRIDQFPGNGAGSLKKLTGLRRKGAERVKDVTTFSGLTFCFTRDVCLMLRRPLSAAKDVFTQTMHVLTCPRKQHFFMSNRYERYLKGYRTRFPQIYLTLLQRTPASTRNIEASPLRLQTIPTVFYAACRPFPSQ